MINFEHIYGWEYTLLEPNHFWSHVPPKVAPYYHFFNAPVSEKKRDTLSVQRFIEEVAKPDDFVAFKLDIDSPFIEIPIALELLKDTKFSSLVDEFFFELHFHCELLLKCAWGNLPAKGTFPELPLDRYHALEYFRQLREIGIRAHIWP